MQMHHIHIRLTLRRKMCRLKRRSKNRKRIERGMLEKDSANGVTTPLIAVTIRICPASGTYF